MDSAILDSAELEAIRGALGQSQSGRTAATAAAENAVPIALIADDRSAERARPEGLKLAKRWAQAARLRLARLCGLKLELEGSSAEILDARTIKEQLAGCWTACVDVPGRPGRGLVAASGSMIEGLAARLLGGSDSAGVDRPPSAAALRLFKPAGDALLVALVDSFCDEQLCEMRTSADDGSSWRRALGDADILVVITVTVAGAVNGKVRLIAPPDTLLAPPAALKVVPAGPEIIRLVLGEIPMVLRVDLGGAIVTMSELGSLRPGQVILLDRAVGDPLPVWCSDQRVGYGRAQVNRGALSVQMTASIEEKK